MTWAAVAVGVGSAVVGAYSANQQNKAARAASSGAGSLNVTTNRDPWGPSNNYRQYAMNQAYRLTGGGLNDDGSPTGWWNPQQPLPTIDSRGGRGGGGGGGGNGGGNLWAGFNGISQSTQDSINRLQDRANQGSPLYDPANRFTIGLLNGEDPNAYRAETFDRMKNISDPYLDRYINELFAGGTPGSGDPFAGYGGVGVGGGGGSYSINFGGGGGGDLVGAQQALKDRIAGKDLDANDPRVQAMVDALSHDVDKHFRDVVIPGVNDTYQGAGRFGGGMYADALGRAGGDYAQNLADTIAKVRFDDYEARKADQAAALQEGAQYDLGVLQNQASGAAAGMSAANAAADRAQALQLARMNALGSAIGQHTGLLQFGSQGMGSLAGMYSQDQMGALGLVPQLSGLDIRDLQAAGELSLNADKNKIGMYDATQQAKARAAANSIARSQLAWQQNVYNREAPMNDLAKYMDIINAASNGYGQEQQWGYNRTGASPTPAGASVWGNALSSGLAGYYAAGGNFGAGNYSPQGASYFGYSQPDFSLGYTGGPAGGAGGSLGTYGYGTNVDPYFTGGH